MECQQQPNGTWKVTIGRFVWQGKEANEQAAIKRAKEVVRRIEERRTNNADHRIPND